MATQPEYDENEPDESYGVTYVELTREEGRAMFEQNAQDWFGISGEEFIRRWEAGETDDMNHTDVIMLALMIPMAR
jgi:hypothetical protein